MIHNNNQGVFLELLVAANKINVLYFDILKLRHLLIIFPSVSIWHRLTKLSILILEGIIKKISYQHRDYESVDVKCLSQPYVPKNDEKIIQEVKG